MKTSCTQKKHLDLVIKITTNKWHAFPLLIVQANISPNREGTAWENVSPLLVRIKDAESEKCLYTMIIPKNDAYIYSQIYKKEESS